MSELAHTLTLMTDALSTADRLYYAIESLRGWEPLLSLHKSRGRDQAWRVGSLISTLLVAGGEENAPIAVSGRASDDGAGEIVVLYREFVVIAEVLTLSLTESDFIVSVLPLCDVSKLRVSTQHNYYSGTEQSARTDGIKITFVLSDRELTLQAAPQGAPSNLTDDAAVYRAFETLRDSHLSAGIELEA